MLSKCIKFKCFRIFSFKFMKLLNKELLSLRKGHTLVKMHAKDTKLARCSLLLML